MKSGGLCVAGFLTLVAPGLVALEPVTVRSQSGQFIVRGLPQGPPRSGSTGAVSYLRLDPSLTAVSLDRIRHTVAAELGLGDKWRAPIHVSTRPVREDDASVRITSVHYKDGWGYRLELPEIVDKPRFLLAAVKVVLLEFANRNAVAREAELPPWLTPGLATELQVTSSLPTLALELGTGIAAQGSAADRLGRARDLLRQRPALTFTQLSLPDPEVLEEDGELYETCAFLLVRELLRLREGRQLLRQTLERLPDALNWQTTFLRVYQAHFPRLIEADKWYTLSVAHLTGRERMSVWPLATTFEHLDEILATPVKVRLQADELPMDARVKLQRIISEWDFERQSPVLEQKLQQLDHLHWRSAPELLDLVRGYHQTLDRYWHRRSRPRLEGSSKVPTFHNPRLLARDAVRKLDALDRKLEALRLEHLPASPAAQP